MGRKLGKAMSSVHWLLLATMVAVELLMSFSFLGYFHIEPISITIAYIPVLIAGALGGPAESLVVGCAFGLASMWKASATYVMDFDQLFSPFLSGHPWESLFLSVGARALTGPCAPEELYRDADQLLYAAKQNGRDQYLIGEPER